MKAFGWFRSFLLVSTLGVFLGMASDAMVLTHSGEDPDCIDFSGTTESVPACYVSNFACYCEKADGSTKLTGVVSGNYPDLCEAEANSDPECEPESGWIDPIDDEDEACEATGLDRSVWSNPCPAHCNAVVGQNDLLFTNEAGEQCCKKVVTWTCVSWGF